MATRLFLTPFGAELPTASFPQLVQTNDRPMLAMATTELAYWTFRLPAGITGTVTVEIMYCMATATSGNIGFEVAVEAISDGDAINVLTTSSFDTANTMTAQAVPGSAGNPKVATITLSNVDSWAAGDMVRLRITRVSVTSNATGDLNFLTGALLDAA